ncbi:hypothetical protein ACLPJK_26550 [Pseudomonas aeruginosa]|uniref:hypothetical protein n=1 Tax=Pseudomonas aeruginosa TaxID=287 RepID=UPI003D2A9D82
MSNPIKIDTVDDLDRELGRMLDAHALDDDGILLLCEAKEALEENYETEVFVSSDENKVRVTFVIEKP